MDTTLISNLIDEKVFGVWFLIGAGIVFAAFTVMYVVSIISHADL